MRRISVRALAAVLLTALGLTLSACVVYDDDGPGYRHYDGWGFHDRDHDHDRGWR